MSRQRRNCSTLSASQWKQLEDAWENMGPRRDQFTRLHSRFGQHSMGGRTNLLFCGWHRALILEFEEALIEAGFPFLPYLIISDGIPAAALEIAPVRGTVNPDSSVRGRRPTRGSRGDRLGRTIPRNLSIPFQRFTADWETNYHNQGHVISGGVMRVVSTAPNSLLFWMHHGYVDNKYEQYIQANRSSVFNIRDRGSGRTMLGDTSQLVGLSGYNIAQMCQPCRSLGYTYA